MVVATRTDYSINSNFTQATLFDSLKTGMTNAGFSVPVDDYVLGTDNVVVYAFITDSTKIYGTTFLRIRVTSTFSIAWSIYSTWNATSHSGTNPSSEAVLSGLVNNNPILFTSLNGGSEYKLLLIAQVTTFIPLGVIAPAIRPSWWNLDTWNYAFIFNSSGLASAVGTALNPYANSNYSLLLNNAFMGISNPQTGNADVLTGVVLFNGSNRGVAGKTSDDLGSACAFGLTRYNIISSGTSQNFLIVNPVSGGLVIKIA